MKKPIYIVIVVFASATIWNSRACAESSNNSLNSMRDENNAFVARQQIQQQIVDLERKIQSQAAQGRASDAKDYEYRYPTSREIAAKEEAWKAANPFISSMRMPDFSTQRIRVPKSDALRHQIAQLEMRLEQLEDDRYQPPTQKAKPPKKPPATRNTPALQTEAQRAKKAAAYEAAFSVSDAKAVELYDFASDPNSEGSKRMLEIDDALKANGDPLYNDPNKPLIIAQMVAKEMRIPPKSIKSSTAKP